MSAVLDLEIDQAGTNGQNGNSERDTWILRLPKEVCDREGFTEGTLISLTIKSGGIDAVFIKPPAKKIRDISDKLKEKNRKLYEELKRVGD